MSRSESLKGNRNAVGRHRQTHYLHMTPEKAEQIRKLYFSRQAKQKELAAIFNVTQPTISRIISGITWS